MSPNATVCSTYIPPRKWFSMPQYVILTFQPESGSQCHSMLYLYSTPKVDLSWQFCMTCIALSILCLLVSLGRLKCKIMCSALLISYYFTLFASRQDLRVHGCNWLIGTHRISWFYHLSQCRDMWITKGLTFCSNCKIPVQTLIKVNFCWQVLMSTLWTINTTQTQCVWQIRPSWNLVTW